MCPRRPAPRVRVSLRGVDPKANLLDRMIAATALANELPLVTRNISDLRGIEDLVELVPR